jgi:hypothetical protein
MEAFVVAVSALKRKSVYSDEVLKTLTRVYYEPVNNEKKRQAFARKLYPADDVLSSPN